MAYMKAFLLITVSAVVALADDKPEVTIVSQENVVEPSGNFHWNYETSDGSKAQQEGELKTEGDTTEEVVKGSYEYTGDDGNVYKLSYEADAKGFRPTGDHVPAIPPLIQRSLDLLATAPTTTGSS